MFVVCLRLRLDVYSYAVRHAAMCLHPIFDEQFRLSQRNLYNHNETMFAMLIECTANIN